MSSERTNDELDELLSAYIDDELTAEERTHVEARLRRDPEAAKLVDQMRLLSGALKSLPRERLGRDLGAIVPLEAQRVRASLASPTLAGNIERPPAAGGGEPEHQWRSGLPRKLAWSVLAIAATLMLSVLLPPQEPGDGPKVAVGRRASEDKEKPRPQGEMRAAPREEKQDGSRATGARSRSVSDRISESTRSAADPGGAATRAEPALSEEPVQYRGMDELAENSSAELAPPEAAPEDSAPPEDEAVELAMSPPPEPASSVPPPPSPSTVASAAAPPSTPGSSERYADAQAAGVVKREAPLRQIIVTTTSAEGFARFDELLNANGIVFDTEPTQLSEGDFVDARGGRTDGPAGAAPTSSRGEGESLPLGVLVEAPPATVDRLLAAFESDESTFALKQLEDATVDKERLQWSDQAMGGAQATADAALSGHAGAREGVGGAGGSIPPRGPETTAESPSPAAAGASSRVAGPKRFAQAPTVGQQESRSLGRAWKVPLEGGKNDDLPLAKKMAMLGGVESAPSTEPRQRVLFLLRRAVEPAGEAGEAR